MKYVLLNDIASRFWNINIEEIVTQACFRHVIGGSKCYSS